MDNLIKNKKIVIACLIIIIISISIYFIIDNKEYFNKEPLVYEKDIIEKYDANTYIPVYVTDNDMANKYLNDYKNLLLNDINKAYNILNKEYRETKYNDENIFNEYINNKKSVAFYKMTVKEYSVFTKNGYKFYYIITSSDDKFIFKELSIMNYEVYLDDYTVELK